MLLKLVNFGSLNIDRVYRVRAFVRPGQTISAQDFACGKMLVRRTPGGACPPCEKPPAIGRGL